MTMAEVRNEIYGQLNVRVGKIKSVKPHPKTNNYILLVDIGIIGADKQLVADLQDSYSMNELIGKKVVIVVNTEPIVVKGIESMGLLLITHHRGRKILVQPVQQVKPGVEVCGLNNLEVSYQE